MTSSVTNSDKEVLNVGLDSELEDMYDDDELGEKVGQQPLLSLIQISDKL